MGSALRIGAVATNRPWRARLQAHVHDHLGDVELLVLRDPELVATLELDVLLVDDSVALFEDHRLRDMIGNGLIVVGVFDPTGQNGRGEASLEALGVETRVADDLSPADLVHHIVGTSEQRRAKPAQREANTDPTPVHDPTSSTRLLVVGGPDAEDNVELACGLAAAAATRSLPLLIDLNEIDPCVAARLGLRLSPNVLDAIVRVSAGEDLAAALARPLPGASVAVDYDVVAGIPRGADWESLDAHGVERVLAHALAMWDRVVACVGSRVERLGRRHDVSRATLSVADEIVVAMRPTPLGLLRGLDWLVEARKIRPELPMMVLFAGRPSSYRRQEIVNLLVERVPEDALDLIEFVPTAHVEKAVWQGAPVGGSFHRALRNFEQQLEELAERDDEFSDDFDADEFASGDPRLSGVAR
jgi:hypothetical protein